MSALTWLNFPLLANLKAQSTSQKGPWWGEGGGVGMSPQQVMSGVAGWGPTAGVGPSQVGPRSPYATPQPTALTNVDVALEQWQHRDQMAKRAGLPGAAPTGLAADFLSEEKQRLELDQIKQRREDMMMAEQERERKRRQGYMQDISGHAQFKAERGVVEATDEFKRQRMRVAAAQRAVNAATDPATQQAAQAELDAASAAAEQAAIQAGLTYQLEGGPPSALTGNLDPQGEQALAEMDQMMKARMISEETVRLLSQYRADIPFKYDEKGRIKGVDEEAVAASVAKEQKKVKIAGDLEIKEKELALERAEMQLQEIQALEGPNAAQIMEARAMAQLAAKAGDLDAAGKWTAAANAMVKGANPEDLDLNILIKDPKTDPDHPEFRVNAVKEFAEFREGVWASYGVAPELSKQAEGIIDSMLDELQKTDFDPDEIRKAKIRLNELGDQITEKRGQTKEGKHLKGTYSLFQDLMARGEAALMAGNHEMAREYRQRADAARDELVKGGWNMAGGKDGLNVFAGALAPLSRMEMQGISDVRQWLERQLDNPQMLAPNLLELYREQLLIYAGIERRGWMTSEDEAKIVRREGLRQAPTGIVQRARGQIVQEMDLLVGTPDIGGLVNGYVPTDEKGQPVGERVAGAIEEYAMNDGDTTGIAIAENPEGQVKRVRPQLRQAVLQAKTNVEAAGGEFTPAVAEELMTEFRNTVDSRFDTAMELERLSAVPAAPTEEGLMVFWRWLASDTGEALIGLDAGSEGYFSARQVEDIREALEGPEGPRDFGSYLAALEAGGWSRADFDKLKTIMHNAHYAEMGHLAGRDIDALAEDTGGVRLYGEKVDRYLDPESFSVSGLKKAARFMWTIPGKSNYTYAKKFVMEGLNHAYGAAEGPMRFKRGLEESYREFLDEGVTGKAAPREERRVVTPWGAEKPVERPSRGEKEAEATFGELFERQRGTPGPGEAIEPKVSAGERGKAGRQSMADMLFGLPGRVHQAISSAWGDREDPQSLASMVLGYMPSERRAYLDAKEATDAISSMIRRFGKGISEAKKKELEQALERGLEEERRRAAQPNWGQRYPKGM